MLHHTADESDCRFIVLQRHDDYGESRGFYMKDARLPLTYSDARRAAVALARKMPDRRVYIAVICTEVEVATPPPPPVMFRTLEGGL